MKIISHVARLQFASIKHIFTKCLPSWGFVSLLQVVERDLLVDVVRSRGLFPKFAGVHMLISFIWQGTLGRPPQHEHWSSAGQVGGGCEIF